MAVNEIDDINRVWKLMEKIGICMLASKDGEKIRSRPMGAHPRQAENAIYFLTDARGHKDEEVMQDEHVCLSFAQPSDGKFLTVTGHARVLNDRERLRRSRCARHRSDSRGRPILGRPARRRGDIPDDRRRRHGGPSRDWRSAQGRSALTYSPRAFRLASVMPIAAPLSM
jgi:hypothetical protein